MLLVTYRDTSSDKKPAERGQNCGHNPEPSPTIGRGFRAEGKKGWRGGKWSNPGSLKDQLSEK